MLKICIKVDVAVSNAHDMHQGVLWGALDALDMHPVCSGRLPC